jgi:hypothetical protein
MFQRVGVEIWACALALGASFSDPEAAWHFVADSHAPLSRDGFR